MRRTYDAFGLTIDSAVPLPAAPGTGDSPDVRIDRTAVDAPALDRTGHRDVVWRGDAVHLWYDDVGAFTIRDGEAIRVDPIEDVPSRTLQFRVAGAAMGVLLHQRGLLVLHASCVDVDGQAVAFAGPSTAGKSTLAAAFHDRGYDVLADDLTATATATSHPTVRPAYQALKLGQDAAGIVTRGGATVDGVADRRYYPLDRETDAARPLAGVYVLTAGESPGIEPTGGSEAFIALVHNSYLRRIFDEEHELARHFRQCTAVADDATVNWLVRPDDLDLLPVLVDRVVADVGT